MKKKRIVLIYFFYFMFLQETYAIEDWYYYDSLTVDKSRYTTITGSPSLSYSSNGLNIDTSITTVALIQNNFLTLPSNYEAEITITSTTNNRPRTGLCFDDLLLDGGDTSTGIYKLSTTVRQALLSGELYSTNDVLKIVKQGNTFTYYRNGVQKWTGTISDDNHYQQFRTYQNRATTFKDLKIKQL